MNHLYWPAKRIILILVLAAVGLSMGFTVGFLFVGKPSPEKGVSLGVTAQVDPVKPTLPPTPPPCTLYANEKFGFSLCYSSEWLPPSEEPVSSEQHLYQVTLNPSGKSYMVNIYDRPAPVSLGSFVRDYFQGVEGGVTWSNDIEINGHEALQFYIPTVSIEDSGIGGVAFAKGGDVLTITTPSRRLDGGDFKKLLVNDETLVQLSQSLNWLE
jgi:hypothetical protein